MTNEQASRVNNIRLATDKMKRSIIDRYHFLLNATDNELLDHCIFIEGILAGIDAHFEFDNTNKHKRHES